MKDPNFFLCFNIKSFFSDDIFFLIRQSLPFLSRFGLFFGRKMKFLFMLRLNII